MPFCPSNYSPYRKACGCGKKQDWSTPRKVKINPSFISLSGNTFFFLGNISTPHNLSLIQKNRDPLPLLSFKTQHKTFALRPQYFLIFFIFPLYFSLFLHPDIFSLMSTVLCIQEFHDLHILLDYNFIW